MKKKTTRRYSSPVRAARVQETQDRILRAVGQWMQQNPGTEFTLDVIALRAGIERRTLFRHFPTKEALLAAFWRWINHRVAPRALPGSLAELIAAPAEVFAAFDAEEGLIRASLHTQAGREMRLAEVPARRQAFRDALRGMNAPASAADRRHLECITHALFSAAAWEAMRDYAGVSGREAGAAVSWALRVLTDAVGHGAASRPAPRAG
jgi:AcrR family transcriptional regulator